MKKSSLIVLCSLILALAVSFVPAIAYGNGLEASEEPTFVGVSEVVSEADDVAPTEVQTDVQTSPLEAEDAPQAADGGSKTEDVTSAPVFSGSAHVQRLGWIDATEGEDGTIVLGTTGQGLRVEAMRLRVSGGSVSYQAHVQSVGWDSWASDGELAGTEGEAKRLEGIKICLTGEVADAWSIQYRCHVQTYGWLGWAADGEIAGSTGFGKRLEAIEVRVVPAGTPLPESDTTAWQDAGLTGSAHVQGIGWTDTQRGYEVTLGTMGQSKRMEAFSLTRSAGIDLAGDIVYAAHVQGVGWQRERSGGQIAGTTGEGRRVEAVAIDLTGELACSYDVWYRAHVQGLGWMAWAKNGELCGSEGLAARMESLQVVLVREGSPSPSADDQDVSSAYMKLPSISYGTQTGGSWSASTSDGHTSGSPDAGGALRGMRATLSEQGFSIAYAAHVMGGAWTDDAWNGKRLVASGDIDALRMRLSGEGSNVLAIWYRTHVQGLGWLQWAQGSQPSGTLNRGYAIDAVQVRIISKYATWPDDGDAGLSMTCIDASSPQLLSEANAMQRRLVRSAETTPWPGASLCAGWVEDVYKNAGVCDVSGNACDLYDRYCTSSNLSELKVGMIIAVRTHTRTQAGSIWGHVGIYVGDGWVMHSVTSGVVRVPLDYWIEFYGTTYTPKWGWLGGVKVA